MKALRNSYTLIRQKFADIFFAICKTTHRAKIEIKLSKLAKNTSFDNSERAANQLLLNYTVYIPLAREPNKITLASGKILCTIALIFIFNEESILTFYKDKFFLNGMIVAERKQENLG